MKAHGSKQVRCAIYTRVSTDQGLEQDFNSLDAQYDASQSYIRSQAHAGWTMVRSKYDDGGFSGGNIARPALQQLLEDIKAGKVDVIVVYKVDRLTRSLADFAKLVELFDQHNVSFVSVTQQFNTTTSMGRLTLNVLLSFAQFEREVTSERIRDKIAASKRKGLWVGGMAPLGYDTKDRKITINEAEAARVRDIFSTYLKLGSLSLLLADLRQRGVTTKARTLKNGKPVGGIAFTRGSLGYLLRNRFYIGQVVFKGEVLSGEQLAILEQPLFDAVQAKLDQQLNNHKTSRTASDALLLGRIYDDRGNRMTPSHARKGVVKYRYYISSALVQGEEERAGNVKRVPAQEIEALITKAVRDRMGSRVRRTSNLPANISGDASIKDGHIDDRSMIHNHVTRVEVHSDKLLVSLCKAKAGHPKHSAVIQIPWRKTPSKRRREILVPESQTHQQNLRPIRAENRATLVASIARGRRWLNEMITNPATTAYTISDREACTVRQVNMTISLAFLAPDLVKAAIQGRLPHGMGVRRLRDLPAEWKRQRHMLGL